MAARARYLCVFARQWKGKLIVIEVISVVIYTIVAGETVRTEGDSIGYRKVSVHLKMAVVAGVCCEGPDVGLMTVTAGEWFICRGLLMPI